MAQWTGSINDKWSEPLNWDTNVVPTSSEFVLVYLDNAIVDVDVDVHVNYLLLGNRIQSFKMNDKTILCNTAFEGTVSAVDVIDCGTSTLIIGNSAQSPTSWCYFEQGLWNTPYYNIITNNDCTMYINVVNSTFFNPVSRLIVQNSLVCNNKISFDPDQNANIYVHIDCMNVDFRNCFVVESGGSENIKIFKNDATLLINYEDGIFIHPTAFIINASANNQVITIPERPHDYSCGSYILSPFNYDTGEYYSGVTFVTPASGFYGLDGCKYMFESSYFNNIIDSGLFCVSATLDFSANDSLIKIDNLNVSSCNLVLNPNEDLYVSRSITVLGTSNISYNPIKKIIFDASYRNMYGTEDTIMRAVINSNVSLPNLILNNHTPTGSFVGSSLSANFTQSNVIRQNNVSSILENLNANLSGDCVIENFARAAVNNSISAATFILSCSDYAINKVSRNNTITTTSGGRIYNAQCEDFTIVGAQVSAYNCFPHPFRNFPTSNFVNADTTIVTTVWNNSGSNNLWSDPSNWSNGIPTSSTIAAFDKNVTSALCILDINTTIFGISARPYAPTSFPINGDWYYNGVVRINDNIDLTIRRFANFHNFGNLSASNMDTCDLILQDSTDSTKRIYFAQNIVNAQSDKFMNIDAINDIHKIFDVEFYRVSKTVNISSKCVTTFIAGTSSTSQFGQCNVIAPKGFISSEFTLKNCNLNVVGSIAKPFGSIVNFEAHNVNELIIPNFYYPIGIGIIVPSINSTFVTTVKFDLNLIPNFTYVNFGSLNVVIDLSDHTIFGNIAPSGQINGGGNYSILLPNSQFYAASISSFIKTLYQSNSVAYLTNEYIPIEFRRVELYNPVTPWNQNLYPKTVISGSDKTIEFTSRADCQGFSAIGCIITNPWNNQPAMLPPFNGSPGIVVPGNIMLSGCITSGARLIDNRNHNQNGYRSQFDINGFILSANSVQLYNMDFVTNGGAGVVYSTVTPSAINVNMRGSRSITTQGDARFSTDLGNNLNWVFLTGVLTSVIPDEGTSWYRTVLLSGADLDIANIYFNGSLITDFITRTPTSATVLVPLKSPGDYEFYLG